MGGHLEIAAVIWCDEQRVGEPGVLPQGRLLTTSTGAGRISNLVADFRLTAYEPHGDGQAPAQWGRRGCSSLGLPWKPSGRRGLLHV